MRSVVELFQIGCRCREGIVTPVKVPCLPLFLRTPELSSMLMKTELLKSVVVVEVLEQKVPSSHIPLKKV